MMTYKRVHIFLLRSYSVQNSLPIPVIKIPKYVEAHVEKVKRRAFVKQLNFQKSKKIAYRGDTSIPVISSTHGDFNFYLGQIYNERYSMPVQSKYWHKAKTSGQKFTIHPVDANPSLPSSDPNEYVNDEYLPNEFSKMDLNCNIIKSLQEEFCFEKPTRIQTLMIPRILSGRHVLMASECGGGKTIAYLAPIINQIASYKKTGNVYPDTPLGLVMVPGRELAEQIGKVAYMLAQSCDVNVAVLIPDGTRLRHLKLYPHSRIDLIVASIGCLAQLFNRRKLYLSNLCHLVFDEADTLLDDSFISDSMHILRKIMIRTSDNLTPLGAQLIFSSSIYPSNMHSIFCKEFPEGNLIKVCSPYLHRVPPHIQQRFWRVSNDGRAGELLSLVKTDYTSKRPVIIFCNKSPTCDWLSFFLEGNGVPNATFHGAVDANKRAGIFKAFQEGEINVLVCTDLASRGLDTQRVQHVINFDFPNNVSDYLLRVGRVGRVGTNHGHVTNLAVSKSGMYTVQDIETAVKKAERLPNVDSNIKKKISKLYFPSYAQN